MSILGISHVTSEVTDLSRAVAAFEQGGYVVEYSMDLPVPDVKQSILVDKPSEARIFYLRNSVRGGMGIELIHHSTNGRPRQQPRADDGQSTIVLALNSKDVECQSIRDPDGNRLVSLSTMEAEQPFQHIFLPVADADASADSYRSVFHMVPRPERQEEHAAASLYPELRRVRTLGFASCLSRNWDGLLHLVEVPMTAAPVPLNRIGFTSFCFLVAKRGVEALSRDAPSLIGPMSVQKVVRGKPVAFQIGFVQDPTGYPIEFYVV
jgi:hypothetical protein